MFPLMTLIFMLIARSLVASFGRQATYTTGTTIMVAAEALARLRWKTGGITLDWTTVIPVTTDTTLADGTLIPSGQRGLQFGTVLCKIIASGKYGPWSPAMTATTVASGGTVLGVTTLTLASGANINPGDSLLIDTAGQQETLEVASVSGAVVTFTSPTTKTHANGVAVTKPDDGRQSLNRGDCYILNESVLQTVPFGLGSAPTNHPAVFDGGKVFKDRLRVGGSGQPSFSAFETAFPIITYVTS